MRASLVVLRCGGLLGDALLPSAGVPLSQYTRGSSFAVSVSSPAASGGAASANPESLVHEVQAAWGTDGLLERMGKGARAEFETRYTEDANYRMLMAIYDDAIAASAEQTANG